LSERGVRVLRYGARDVLGNTEGVVRQVVGIARRRLGRPID